LPGASLPGNPGENTLLPQTINELTRLGLAPREVALEGGFTLTATTGALEDLAPDRIFIAGRQQPGSRRTHRRLQRYRTGLCCDAYRSPKHRCASVGRRVRVGGCYPWPLPRLDVSGVRVVIA